MPRGFLLILLVQQVYSPLLYWAFVSCDLHHCLLYYLVGLGFVFSKLGEHASTGVLSATKEGGHTKGENSIKLVTDGKPSSPRGSVCYVKRQRLDQFHRMAHP